MAIMRWEPFRNMAALQNRINRMFDDAFPDRQTMEENMAMCAWQPTVDIFETEAGIVIQADLPGVEKENVSVEIKDNVLNLSGERYIETAVDEDQYYRRERCAGKFHRAFDLQRQVDPARITAKFKNGVLQIEVPRPEAERLKKIKVEID